MLISFKKTALSLTFLSCIILLAGCSKNRYELVRDEQANFLLDKETGTVWIMVDSKWYNLGSPAVDAPNKGDEASMFEKKTTKKK